MCFEIQQVLSSSNSRYLFTLHSLILKDVRLNATLISSTISDKSNERNTFLSLLRYSLLTLGHLNMVISSIFMLRKLSRLLCSNNIAQLSANR